MNKIIFILFAVLTIASCDLLNDQDSDSFSESLSDLFPPVNDVLISSIETTPFAKRGEIITVDITVANSGTSTVDKEFEIILHNQSEDVIIGNKTLTAGLAPKDSVGVSFSWNTGNATTGVHILVAKHTLKDDNAANDSLKTTVTVGESDITDIAVTSIEAPSEAIQGDNVELKMKIENQGNQDVDEAIIITLVDQISGTTIDSKSISGGLDAGAVKSMTFNWDTEGATPGNHLLAARHNLDDDNSDNDSKSIEIQIIEAIFLDIAITTIITPDKVEKGDKVNIEVTLRNLGNRDVHEDIIVTLADQTQNNIISIEILKGGLKIDSSKTLKFVWNTRGKGRVREGKHTLIVSHNFADDNLANNSRTFTITVEDD